VTPTDTVRFVIVTPERLIAMDSVKMVAKSTRLVTYLIVAIATLTVLLVPGQTSPQAAASATIASAPLELASVSLHTVTATETLLMDAKLT